jgi:hypothetical protein
MSATPAAPDAELHLPKLTPGTERCDQHDTQHHRFSISAEYSTAMHGLQAVVLYEEVELQRFWDRFRGKGREVGWLESLRKIVCSSCTSCLRDQHCSSYEFMIIGLNILFVAVPLAWGLHSWRSHSGITFGRMSKFLVLMHILMSVQSASWLSYRWLECSTIAESKWRTTSGRAWVISLSSH